MGQYISTIFYNNNDELITMLINKRYIETKDVEIALRSVDRRLYYRDDKKHVAYRHSVYRSGQHNLSAPSVYAIALEYLELHPGHKFLNIGSGVGYFSTVVGVLLGRYGVNHGIEMCSSLINYAYQKLEEFKLSAAAIDHYEFCEPVFIHGNAFDLLPTGYYDRVYCEAGVPEEKLDFVKLLIKVGGTLVMPFDGKLLRVYRIAENKWKAMEVFPFLFRYLDMPENCSFNAVKFPSVEPLSLRELCRLNIRSILRENLKQEFPNLAMRTKCQNTTLSGDIDDQEELEEFMCIKTEEAPVYSRELVHWAFPNTSFMADNLEDHLEPSVEVPDGNSVDARVERDEVQLRTNDANTMNELIKRKTIESGCSEQHETSTDTVNLKRMKLDTPPQKTDSMPSTSSHSASDYWGQTASTSECPEDHLESYIEVPDGNSIDARVERDEVILGTNDANTMNELIISDESSIISDDSSECSELDEFGNKKQKEQFYKSLISPRGGESNNEESEDMYNFYSKRNENELSKKIRDKINLLPLPPLLKAFLNYD